MTSQTADAILDCAHALLMERGYNGFSYADIAKIVGLTKASIHHHFPTKAALGKEVVARYRGTVRASLAYMASAGFSPTQQVQGYVAYWAACIRDKKMPFCICALLAAEISALPEEIGDEVRGHFREVATWLTGVLEDGARQGHFVLTQPAAQEADGFMAVVHGGMLAARALDSSEVFDSVTSAILSRLIK